MRYSTFLRKSVRCPFCAPAQRAFASNGRAYLTYSIAPYAKYHLLAIPKRHVESFLDLTAAEARDVQAMVTRGATVLRAKGIDDYTILVRNGENSGKSVPHLHYHLIPRHRIGDLDREQQARRIMTSAEVRALAAAVGRVLGKRGTRGTGRKARVGR